MKNTRPITMTPEMEQRLRERGQEREMLAQDLKQKYLRPGIPDEVAERVFRKAWDDGHASGNHEVEMQYDELSEIVNAAFKAGKKESK